MQRKRKNQRLYLKGLDIKYYRINVLSGLPAPLIAEVAERRRKCNQCNSIILAGDECFGDYLHTTGPYPVRRNYCAICAEEYFKAAVDEHERFTKYMRAMTRAIPKYIELKKLRLRKLFESKL